MPPGGAAWAIVVAGGEGRRFGRAKQFEPLGDRLVVDWSVAAARAVAEEVVLVLPAADLADPRRCAACERVVAGGTTRAASVRAGLGLVPAAVPFVIVHDAARPLASAALFASVLEAVRAGAEGAIPALAVSDTVKRVRAGAVVETLDRSELVTVQTPQAFRSDVLRRAHAGAPEATDDAALVEAIGGRVVAVAGEPRNLKITGLDDLARLTHWATGGDGVAPEPGTPEPGTPETGAPEPGTAAR